MSWSVRLFQLRGIDVRVHLTFVLILVWGAYNWGGSTGQGLRGALFGVAAILLLFVAVTLHELGHSFQAQKYGVRVRGITLLPLGGVSEMAEMPEKPGQELRIALAGPLVNLAIAALLAGVGALLILGAIATLPELIDSLGKASWEGMLAYLFTANLALALFNLIPAFPMDGGRVLRALLALRLDYARATAYAVTIGQGLALLLGLWGFASGSFVLMLIAVFVWVGAGQEGRQVAARSVLGELTVGQAMTRRPETLLAGETLARAMELTLSTSQADFPVADNGRLVGLLTSMDLLKGLHTSGVGALVGQVMRHEPPTTTAAELLFRAQRRMAESRVSAMPVIAAGGNLVGLLTTGDIGEAYGLLSASPKLAAAR